MLLDVGVHMAREARGGAALEVPQQDAAMRMASAEKPTTDAQNNIFTWSCSGSPTTKHWTSSL
eukprot:301136-Pyramimonas_sp.AAC.1